MSCCKKLGEAIAEIVDRLEDIVPFIKEVFNVSLNGQTVFALTEVSNNPARSELHVNGNLQEYGIDYTISGSMLTWLDNDFTLTIGDKLIINYN